ncbi:MAG TPA: Spy/CpxP family protein refolding chaperone [Pyrinomonadaceae bacterium]|nr:Spy/CpxP family protein refolding chaperone [Pyrinomonadaceae bacterium]
MKSYIKIFLPFAAAVLLGSLTLAFAQTKTTETKSFSKGGRGGHGEFRRMPPPNGLNPRILEQIGLTDAQKTQIQTLLENSRSASQSYFEKLRGFDEQIRSLAESKTFDETQARAILKEKADVQIELDLIRLKTDAAVLAVLTTEQLAKLETLKQQRPEFPPRGEFRPDFPPPPTD